MADDRVLPFRRVRRELRAERVSRRTGPVRGVQPLQAGRRLAERRGERAQLGGGRADGRRVPVHQFGRVGGLAELEFRNVRAQGVPRLVAEVVHRDGRARQPHRVQAVASRPAPWLRAVPVPCLTSFHKDPNGFPIVAHPAPPALPPGDGGGPNS